MKMMFTSLITILFVTNFVLSDPLPSTSPSSLSNQAKISTDLVLDAFELLRQLIQKPSLEENKEKSSNELSLANQQSASHYSSPLLRLDPLCLNKPIVHESRDLQNPTLGKIVLTLDNVRFSGLSSFKVEQVTNSGPCLNFQHLIPQMDSCANYTVDYYLFDSIPLRISEGNLKATIPRAKIVGRFFSFASLVGDWSRTAQFNLTTTVDDQVDLMVSPKYTISDRFVLDKSMGSFDAAIRSALPEVSEILRNAYTKVIEMKLSD